MGAHYPKDGAHYPLPKKPPYFGFSLQSMIYNFFDSSAFTVMTVPMLETNYAYIIVDKSTQKGLRG